MKSLVKLSLVLLIASCATVDVPEGLVLITVDDKVAYYAEPIGTDSLYVPALDVTYHKDEVHYVYSKEQVKADKKHF